MLYSHSITMTVINYTNTYIYGIQTGAMIIDEWRFLYKKMYLSLYSKRVTQGFMVRGSWRPNRTAIFWHPTLMAVSVVSFSFSWAAQPEAQGLSFLLSAGFLYHILSATSLDPKSSDFQLNRGPRGPLRSGVNFPQLVYNCNSNCLTFCLDWVIYNSSTSSQLPTRSLEWHVWSSSSGNNCHAVHRSLSSGASVYECTMGILACPILLVNFRPRDFPS